MIFLIVSVLRDLQMCQISQGEHNKWTDTQAHKQKTTMRSHWAKNSHFLSFSPNPGSREWKNLSHQWLEMFSYLTVICQLCSSCRGEQLICVICWLSIARMSKPGFLMMAQCIAHSCRVAEYGPQEPNVRCVKLCYRKQHEWTKALWLCASHCLRKCRTFTPKYKILLPFILLLLMVQIDNIMGINVGCLHTGRQLSNTVEKGFVCPVSNSLLWGTMALRRLRRGKITASQNKMIQCPNDMALSSVESNKRKSVFFVVSVEASMLENQVYV